ncbi:pilus assembly protein [Allochromatium vinosum]|uniref:pilus assembly protein n=1 Tax=Allochromatium vinosum TaxID=1049 RepID=UPI0019086492|nr:PilC/PilY family type IV pilus protein [Allochromatium vinosum]MBK1654360.1 hypothetical protein [Allochromatium vinosum]
MRSSYDSNTGGLGVFSLALGFSALIGAASVQADDIDFYLLPPQDPVAPNVLFLLDLSTSMDSNNKWQDMRDAMDNLLSNEDVMDDVNAAIMTWTTYDGENSPLSLLVKSDFLRVGDNRATMLSSIRGSENLDPSDLPGGTHYTPTVKTLEQGVKWFNTGFQEYTGTTQNPTQRGRSYASPMSDSDYWCAPNHMVLLTDGAPNSNSTSSGQRYGLAQYPAGTSCISDPYKSGDGRCSGEIVSWAYQTDLLTAAEWKEIQNITTHTIGFQTGTSERNYLSRIATLGGGGYYEAESSGDLLNAFQDIVGQATSEVEYTYNAPVIPVSATNASVSGDYIYVPLFAPKPNKLWMGNVKKYRIEQQDDNTLKVLGTSGNEAVDSSGMFNDDAKNYWDPEPDGEGGDVLIGGAAGQIGDEPDDPDEPRRNLYTWLDGNVRDLTAAVNRLHQDNLLEENDGAISNSLLTSQACTTTEHTECVRFEQSCPDGYDLTEDDRCRKRICWWWSCWWDYTNPARVCAADGYVTITETSCTGGDLLDWLNFTGTHTYPFINMGAPLHTQPLLVRYASAADVVYQPTSQGLLHAFDENTGKENWAFMPDELLHTIDDAQINAALSENESPMYGLDGPMVLVHEDTNEDGSVDSDESALLLVSMRRGGRNIYALDVSTPSSPRLAWEIKGGVTTGFDKLAQTWSTPQIGKIKGHDGTVVAFGGGYDEDQDAVTGSRQNDDIGNAIYIVDASDGTLVKTVTNSGGDINISAMNNSIVSGVRLVDIDNDGYAERLYAADVGGRVIRVDLEANNGAGAGGILADVNEGNAAGNRRFFTEPEIGYLSQGQRYLVITIGSGNRPDPLSNTVADRFYAIKDYDIFQAKDWDNFTPYTHASNDFLDITTNMVQVGTEEQQQAVVEDLQDRKGWFYTLPNTGEKVLSKALIANYAAMFTTYSGERSDEISPCEASSTTGTARFYALDLRHGGGRFDLDGDGSLDTDDRSVAITSIGGLPPPPNLFFTRGGDGDGGDSGPSEIITLVGLDEVIRWSDRFKAIYWEQLIDATDDN